MFRHTLSVDPAERLQNDYADPFTDPGYETDKEAASKATEPTRLDEQAYWEHVDSNQPILLVLAGIASHTLVLSSSAPDPLRRQVVRLPELTIERAGMIATSLLEATTPQRLVLLQTIEPHLAAMMKGTVSGSGVVGDTTGLVLVFTNNFVQEDDQWLNVFWQQKWDEKRELHFLRVEMGFISGLAAALLAECSWRHVPAMAFLAVEDDDGPNSGTMQTLLEVLERSQSFPSRFWCLETKQLRRLQTTRHQMYV